jgi:hypothetical protein
MGGGYSSLSPPLGYATAVNSVEELHLYSGGYGEQNKNNHVYS